MYTNEKKLIIDVNTHQKIYHFIYDSDVEVVINLNEDGAKIDYYLGIISNSNNKCSIKVMHNKNNTTSNIVLHGINVLNNNLVFDVSGVIPSDSYGCVCKENNRIINLNDGVSSINPNLLIRNYDTESFHSAYISSLDEEKLFYLEKMGLSKKKAREVIIKSFLVGYADKNNEVVSDIINRLSEVTNG